MDFLGSILNTYDQNRFKVLETQMALEEQVLSSPQAQEALALLDEMMQDPYLQSWLAPLEGPSRAAGAAIDGRNPLAAAQDWNAPALSQVLGEMGAPNWLATGSEFAIPDGMGPLDEGLAMIPFLRALKNADPAVRETVLKAVDNPEGRAGFMRDAMQMLNDMGATPVGRHGAVELDGTRIMLMPSVLDDGRPAVQIGGLLNESNPVGGGAARELLGLLDLADAHLVPTTAMPAASGRLPQDGLVDMYERVGFEYPDPNVRTGMQVREPYDVTQTQAARNFREAQGTSASFRNLGAGGVNRYADAIANMDPSKRGFLTPHTAEDLQQMVGQGYQVRMNDQGVGYILSPEGDLQGVINTSGIAGAGEAAIRDAIANGAKTLDAFDGYLPDYYRRFGFEETGRAAFDPQYAPADWDYVKYGRPDVVFMRLGGK